MHVGQTPIEKETCASALDLGDDLAKIPPGICQLSCERTADTVGTGFSLCPYTSSPGEKLCGFLLCFLFSWYINGNLD